MEKSEKKETQISLHNSDWLSESYMWVAGASLFRDAKSVCFGPFFLASIQIQGGISQNL